ncbi:MAG: hypothetical protein K0R73_1338 [Candidatus Midichloriaceae bacterium]|jgi:hypothetical protein|nr:hypothetical protein [Candidatus Midichloriaceae bacterium]
MLNKDQKDINQTTKKRVRFADSVEVHQYESECATQYKKQKKYLNQSCLNH